jgi:ferredoxin-NADP reductase
MAIVKKYKAEVVEVQNSLPGIYTVLFKSGNGKFRYNPGQFLHLTLDNYDPSLPWPESRCFSIQSSPSEELLKITFAVKGGFTQRMEKEILPGREIWLKLPYGDIFDRGHSINNCVFIAGGTGVTPFLSLFKDAAFSLYKDPVLYLGFRSEKYNIFAGELSEAGKIQPEFDIRFIYQDTDGILDIESIYRTHSDATFFISGPPAMIKSFKSYLLGNGISERNILTDDWE